MNLIKTINNIKKYNCMYIQLYNIIVYTDLYRDLIYL